MNIDSLTIGQAKELAAMFSATSPVNPATGLNAMIGKKCIIRTESAGVWFGEIAEKSGNEVIVKNARRMWRWFAAESISLSGVANSGIDRSKSNIAPTVGSVWLQAIELIPTTKKAEESIEGAEDAKAQ